MSYYQIVHAFLRNRQPGFMVSLVDVSHAQDIGLRRKDSVAGQLGRSISVGKAYSPANFVSTSSSVGPGKLMAMVPYCGASEVLRR